jgi:hypothetical protein
MTYEGSNTYHLYFVEDIDLYPLSAGLSGVVIAQISTTSSIPAEGATIEANFGDWQTSPSLFTTAADIDGNYEFSDLPATPHVDIRVLPYDHEGTNFNVALVGDIPLEPAASVQTDPILLTPALEMPLVLSNNFMEEDVELDQDLILSFSVSMNPTVIEVNLTGPSGSVLCLTGWDSSLTTLTIDPTLILMVETEYTLTITAQSMLGAEFTEEFTFAITFDMAADPQNPNNIFQLKYNGEFEIYCDVSWINQSTTAVITPLEPLLQSSPYELYAEVYSTIPNDSVAYFCDFSTAPAEELPAIPTGFMITNSSDIDYDTIDLDFAWHTSSNVNSYCIYARSDLNYTTWLKIAEVPSSYPLDQQLYTATLPSIYDYLLDDGIPTPFSDGLQLFFRLSAVNEIGESSLSSQIIAEDVVPPSCVAIGLLQIGTADNSLGTEPITFRIEFEYETEYCSSNNPQFMIEETGGTAYTLPVSAFIWTWREDYFLDDRGSSWYEWSGRPFHNVWDLR